MNDRLPGHVRMRAAHAVAFCVVSLLISVWPAAWAQSDGISKVDFYTVQRDYLPLADLSQAYIEADLLRGDQGLAEQASRKLAQVLPVALASLPAHARRELQSVRFYLLWGEASPQGGMRSGMRYVRRGEPAPKNGHDPRWEHSIVIYSAQNLMYLDELWSKKALVHELAHAWHVTNWPDQYAPIRQAWTNAVQSGLYKNVTDHKHRAIASAYAIKNPLEYFAELSAARFVGINYYPFDKERLERYDPMGYRMVESLWAER